MEGKPGTTDRKRLLELEKKVKLLERIIDSLPTNIYWKNLDGVHLGCNLGNARSANLRSPDDIIGKTDYELSWKEKAGDIVATDKIVMTSGQEVSVEEAIFLPGEDKESFFLSRKMPLYDDIGQIMGIVGISDNITELKEAQEATKAALARAEAADEKRAMFLSNQQHDIITSMSGIIYAGQIVQGEEDKDEIISWGKSITACGQRFHDYNTSLLKGLTWMQDRGRIVNARCCLNDIIEQLYDMNLLVAKSHDLKLDFDITPDDAPEYYITDELVLFQCLQNLVTNAIKFTKSGEVSLKIHVLSQTDDKVVMAFHVKDTGRGIDKTHQRLIFDEFYKVLPSNQPDLIKGVSAEEDKGRGLGLYLTKKQAEALGGEVFLKWTEVGKGSEFVLTLPLKVSLNQES